jgi:hypothetical protein
VLDLNDPHPWSLVHACKAAGVKATCVVAICSEGDNSDDAAAMADAAADMLGLAASGGGGMRVGRWAVPPSWVGQVTQIARHVTELCLAQESRIRSVLDDVLGNVLGPDG